MKPKSFVTLLAVAVILGSIIGGALAGGIVIGKSQGGADRPVFFHRGAGEFPVARELHRNIFRQRNYSGHSRENRGQFDNN